MSLTLERVGSTTGRIVGVFLVWNSCSIFSGCQARVQWSRRLNRPRLLVIGVGHRQAVNNFLEKGLPDTRVIAQYYLPDSSAGSPVMGCGVEIQALGGEAGSRL